MTYNFDSIAIEFPKSKMICWTWESPTPKVYWIFPFHPLTSRHRVNNFKAQKIYSQDGLKPTVKMR